MSESNKSTIIIMKPNGKTRRYNVSSKMIFLLIVSLVILPILGIIGGIASIEAWRMKSEWITQCQALQQQVDRDKIEIERLGLLVSQAKKSTSNKSVSIASNTVDKKIVQIANPSFRYLGERKFRLVMELYSVTQPSPVEGRILFSVITANGDVYPLSHDDTSFYIIRFKKVVAQANIPIININMDGASMLVEVLSQGTVIFRNKYPIIQSTLQP